MGENHLFEDSHALFSDGQTAFVVWSRKIFSKNLKIMQACYVVISKSDVQ